MKEYDQPQRGLDSSFICFLVALKNREPWDSMMQIMQPITPRGLFKLKGFMQTTVMVVCTRPFST